MLAVLCALFGCVSSTSAAATTLLSKERISVTNNENLEVCVGEDKSSYTKAFLPQPVQEFMNQKITIPSTSTEISVPLMLALLLMTAILGSVKPDDPVASGVAAYFEGELEEEGEEIEGSQDPPDDNQPYEPDEEESEVAGKIFMAFGVLLLVVLGVISFPETAASFHNSMRSIDLETSNGFALQYKITGSSPATAIRREPGLTCGALRCFDNATLQMLEYTPLIYLVQSCRSVPTECRNESPNATFGDCQVQHICKPHANGSKYICKIPLYRAPCVYFTPTGSATKAKKNFLKQVSYSVNSDVLEGALYLMLGLLVMQAAKRLSDNSTVHYLFGAILAIIFAIAMAGMFFYKQVSYLRRSMGGPDQGGSMGLGGYFSPARYAESFLMLLMVAFPLSFNVYGSMKDTLVQQLHSRLLTLDGDPQLDMPLIGTVYQPCKTFVGISAICGCLFIYLSGWFTDPNGRARTVLRVVIWCIGALMSVQATHDIELSIAIVLLMLFGPLNLFRWIHWFAWKPYYMTVGSTENVDYEKDDFDPEPSIASPAVPMIYRRHKRHQLDDDQYEREAELCTSEQLVGQMNALRNDADAKAQSERCIRVPRSWLRDFQTGKRNHMGQVINGKEGSMLIWIFYTGLQLLVVCLLFCLIVFAGSWCMGFQIDRWIN